MGGCCGKSKVAFESDTQAHAAASIAWLIEVTLGVAVEIEWGERMEPATAKDLIELLAERATAWHALWAVFYTVSAAVVALVASGKVATKRRWLVSAIVAVGFLFFAGGNYLALEQVRKQRVALVEFVKEKAVKELHVRTAAEALMPPSVCELRAYHWGLCLFVVILLFAIPALQKTAKSGSSGPS
jgi:hypothetical protein